MQGAVWSGVVEDAVELGAEIFSVSPGEGAPVSESEALMNDDVPVRGVWGRQLHHFGSVFTLKRGTDTGRRPRPVGRGR